jgi:hypothetical protein
MEYWISWLGRVWGWGVYFLRWFGLMLERVRSGFEPSPKGLFTRFIIHPFKRPKLCMMHSIPSPNNIVKHSSTSQASLPFISCATL